MWLRRSVKFKVGEVTDLRRNLWTSSAESFHAIRDTMAKVNARKDVFHEYEKQELFAPSGLSWLANRLMFYHLHRPLKTQVDLLEFIQGASYAMEATMMAMYSSEFADYVAREEKAPGPLTPDCETAEMVYRSLETVSYDAFKKFVLKSTAAGVRAEMKKLELHSAHLLSVNYHRIARGQTTNSTGQKILGLPMDERLQLAVLFDFTEHVKMTLPDSEVDEELVSQRHQSIWQFQSKVTTPEDVDWVIEPLNLNA